MRIRIIFSNKKKKIVIPASYNYLLMVSIYYFLSDVSKEFVEKLKGIGYSFEKRSYRNFTFSFLRAQHHFENGYIVFKSDIEWFISSPSSEFIEVLFDAILKKGYMEIYAKNIAATLKIAEVQVCKEQRFSEEENYFVLLSPILVSKNIGKKTPYYLRVGDPGFGDYVRENLIKRYTSFYGREPKDKRFYMEWDKDYIASGKKTGKVIHIKKGIKVYSNMVPFKAGGSLELLRFGYEAGFGEKNSLGFGMVKLK